MNVVDKFGDDDFLERTWALPPETTVPLRDLVDMTDDGWIVDVWPVTERIAELVQPYVDRPIDVRSGQWFVSAYPEALD